MGLRRVDCLVRSHCADGVVWIASWDRIVRTASCGRHHTFHSIVRVSLCGVDRIVAL